MRADWREAVSKTSLRLGILFDESQYKNLNTRFDSHNSIRNYYNCRHHNIVTHDNGATDDLTIYLLG